MTFYNLNDALKIALDLCIPTTKIESIGLFEADGRVLAEDLMATKSLPPFDNSAMDGYAVKLSSAGKSVDLMGSLFAGEKASDLTSGKAIKIMTGAPVPNGAEAVVPFENAVVNGDEIYIPENLKMSANIRKAGEELKSGELLFAKGTQLNPAKIALIASQGVMAIKVFEKLKVTVVSGGDEIVEPWEIKEDHQIYNTNSIALVSSIKKSGFNAHYASIGKDRVEKLTASVESAIESSDAVITTGGVSVGEADYTRKALENLGATIHFHGLNIKPGKPTMLATIGKKLVVALPGNPLSALANFHLIVLPALFKLQGANEHYNDLHIAKNGEDLKIKTNRDIAIFGKVSGGRFVAFNGGKYGSGMLTPIAQSNAIALFDASSDLIAKGSEIKIILLNSPKSGEFVDLINRQI